jgi:hypothetical protein
MSKEEKQGQIQTELSNVRRVWTIKIKEARYNKLWSYNFWITAYNLNLKGLR